jgi:hypothetical protein
MEQGTGVAMTITKERLEAMAIATGEFDTASHVDLQEIARLALRGLEVQWRPIDEAPLDGKEALGIKSPYEPTIVWEKKGQWEYFERICDEVDKINPTHYIPLSALGKPEA